MNKLKTFSILAFSLIFLAACFDSDSDDNNGGKAVGPGDLSSVCQANTAEEFFAAMAGQFDLLAVDTFVEGNQPATTDDTFTDGESYTLSYKNDLSLTIQTNKEAVTFSYDDSADDFIDFSDSTKYVMMHKDGVRSLTRVDCVEEPTSFFVTFHDYTDQNNFGNDFFWRLDQETEASVN